MLLWCPDFRSLQVLLGLNVLGWCCGGGYDMRTFKVGGEFLLPFK